MIRRAGDFLAGAVFGLSAGFIFFVGGKANFNVETKEKPEVNTSKNSYDYSENKVSGKYDPYNDYGTKKW